MLFIIILLLILSPIIYFIGMGLLTMAYAALLMVNGIFKMIIAARREK